MAEALFSSGDLDEFYERMTRLYMTEYPKEAKRHLRKEATRLKTQLRQNTALAIKQQKTGNLTKAKNYTVYGLKAYNNGFQVRVANKAPHAHLFEHGHEGFVWSWGKMGFVHIGYVEGRHPAAYTKKSFEVQFIRDTADWVEDMLDRNL